jgi:flagellar motor switch protein FliN/FliY
LTGGAIADIEIRIEDAPLGTLRMLISQPLVMAFTDPTEQSASVPSSPGFGVGPAAGTTVDASLTMSSGASSANVDILLDVPLNITIELGRTRLSIRKILELGPGSIIELDRLAGEPVDLLVNDKVVARGEVVVVDEYFGIRVLSLISPEERIKQLR